ncbi:hypothetical protein ACFSQT_31945 [Mesorhizobium calcicola]|uniref:Uncharacterized protein n=1 Tax=Mesorhizobium calcicola TaxID=1300310 RepID=A0ABW4WLT2_9HYPH
MRPAAGASEDEVFDYVSYARDNVAGETSEHWYHGGRCGLAEDQGRTR